MVVGTTSHAGKSLLTAVICRILARKGWRVTPFKGQNMALNAYVTANGDEIGHAQAVQAWAAGIEPRVEMNPILLKPQGDMTSQVILKGKAVGQVGAADYYQKYFDLGWQAIAQSLQKLAQDFDWVVCEGAGSPAEINLKHRDLTNMRVAKYLNAPTLLVADIDRGGVFAHVVGTLELLDPDERALIQGVVINKFRGQRSLLQSGITWLEERTGIPVVGVIPWLEQAFPAEDSLDLFERRAAKQTADLTIAVIRLPRIANFTDFDPLEAEPTVNLRYVSPNQVLGHPDAVIIPGSKTTIADLITLQETGMAEQLQAYAATRGTIMGICGGFQMLGKAVVDLEGIEGKAGEYKGLDLLPLRTVLTEEKVTCQRQAIAQLPTCQFNQVLPFQVTDTSIAGLSISGYEIHQGRTYLLTPKLTQPLFDDPELGLVNQDHSIWGTYLHGLLDNGPWRRAWLNHLRQQRGLELLPTQVVNYHEQRETLLDSVTDAIAPYLDLQRFVIE